MGDELVVQPADHVGHRPLAAGFVHHLVAPFVAADSQELDVCARQVVERAFAQDQEARHRRHGIIGRDDHLGGGQPLLERPIVRGKGLGIDRRRQVFVLETSRTQIGQAGGANRPGVEMRVAVPALLAQYPLVLRAGDGAARPHPNPGPAPVAHRRGVRGPDGDDRNVLSRQHVLADRQRRRRHDVPVGLDVGELSQQFVRDLDPLGPSVVVRSHEDDARTPVVRQIVGEGADGFPYPRRGVALQRLLALDPIGFEVRHHGFELTVGVCVRHRAKSDLHRCTARSERRRWRSSINSGVHRSAAISGSCRVRA